MQNTNLNIGLFGFGVVGEGIYRVLQDKPELGLRISRICVKNPLKKRNADPALFTFSAADILDDTSIDVVLELIDDAEAAFCIVHSALQKGKHVVTANKKMLADKLDVLRESGTERGVSLLYEAAVCGSIPLIRNLEEYFDNDALHSVRGIVNGSTNYILSRMSKDRMTYNQALELAQDLGFAESNPSLDVEAFDAVYKLSLIIFHAYGLSVLPDQIPRYGITSIHKDDFSFAESRNSAIKLIAHSFLGEENRIHAFVLPAFVDKNSHLESVNNEYNGVEISSSLADSQLLLGKGAGRYPTSGAVLSDLSALRYNYRYSNKKAENKSKYALSNEKRLRVYISYEKGPKIDLDLFDEVEELFQSKTRKFVIGTTRLDQLIDSTIWNDPRYSLIAF